MTIIGVITAVISAVLANGIVFRSLSAPRAVWLIPNGRLKLLLGAFSTQLLLAVFISSLIATLTASGLSSHGTPSQTTASVLATMFAATYAALTLQFIGYYLASQSRFGGFWLSVRQRPTNGGHTGLGAGHRAMD
jgi:hypothetical protein